MSHSPFGIDFFSDKSNSLTATKAVTITQKALLPFFWRAHIEEGLSVCLPIFSFLHRHSELLTKHEFCDFVYPAFSVSTLVRANELWRLVFSFVWKESNWNGQSVFQRTVANSVVQLQHQVQLRQRHLRPEQRAGSIGNVLQYNGKQVK